MEQVQNLANAIGMATVLAGVVLALRRRDPPVRWPGLLAAGLPAYMILAFAGELMTAALVAPLGPVSVEAMALLALVPAALVAATALAALRWPLARRAAMLAPLGGLAFLLLAIGFLGFGSALASLVLLAVAVMGGALVLRATAPGRGTLRMTSLAVVAVLVVVAVPSGFLYVALGLQEPQQAHHVWAVEVRPEGPGPYVLRVPFLNETGSSDQPEQRSARHRAVLDMMIAALRPDGLTAGLADDRRSLVLRGDGPGAVRSEVAYYGDVGWREVNFDAFDREVTMASGPGRAAVTWHMSLSGGEGHSCWTTADMAATVAPGGNATLAGPDPDGDGRGGSQTKCA